MIITTTPLPAAPDARRIWHPRICIECNNIFMGRHNGKRCASCSTCKMCGKDLRALSNGGRRKFCSSACRYQFLLDNHFSKNWKFTEFELGYLAALIDGEGCISFMIQNKKGPVITPCVSIGNTNHDLVKWIYDRIGGGTFAFTRGKGNRKDHWHWAIFSIGARNLLEIIAPHLKVKYSQAELALSVKAHIQKGSLSNEERQIRVDALAKMHELNKRGRK